MDPEFFERINVLQNYQNQQSNQANLQQLKANEAELRKLRQQLNQEANKPQCPHCGGPSEQGFDRCKNCGQEVIWCGHFVGKPGTMAELELADREWRKTDKKRKNAEFEKAKAFRKQAVIERQQLKQGYWALGIVVVIFLLFFGWFLIWAANYDPTL